MKSGMLNFRSLKIGSIFFYFSNVLTFCLINMLKFDVDITVADIVWLFSK